ncbi:hypothetical protein REISMN_06855 [Rickettsia tamurae subsp. buchneri]|uniref:Uncharacterized protein n=1 Tax=Rickettsia tamurae subsp. buchneri TaxID=1462938 RepID=A0A8E0WKW3_9RICK|nr:hypothetical protein REIS_1139 [Rickettsia endosymbiont of Ixodes scapularis]KDO02470.1 hypothetical protein REISMN_06855 [Rickettsia tamurae subsp. buchneri]
MFLSVARNESALYSSDSTIFSLLSLNKACITFFFNSSGDANNVRKCSKSTLLSVTFVTPISAPIALKKISHFFSEVKCWIGIIPLYFIKLERKIILL